MSIKKGFIFLLLSVFVFSCKTVPEKKLVLERPDIRQIRNNYRVYKSLSASFSISGTIENKTFSYAGNLSAKFNQGSKIPALNITIQDPVFLSPLLRIQLSEESIYYKNFLENREEKVPYEGATVYLLSKKAIPAEILVPAMTCVLQDEFFENSDIKKKNDLLEFLTVFREYNSIFSFSGNAMEKIEVFHNDEKQIGFAFQGNKTKERIYPERIFIDFGKGDNLKIIFKNLKIEE